jgi:hypothetical protein
MSNIYIQEPPTSGKVSQEVPPQIPSIKPRHGGFLERVYEIELDTKTEYEEFYGTISTFQNGYFKKNRRSRF